MHEAIKSQVYNISIDYHNQFFQVSGMSPNEMMTPECYLGTRPDILRRLHRTDYGPWAGSKLLPLRCQSLHVSSLISILSIIMSHTSMEHTM